MDWVDFACFYCGRTGHLKANCPDLHRQAPSPSHTATAPGPTLPASYIEIAELRARKISAEEAEEVARRYASQIRAARGWDRQTREAKLREIAREQVEESRRERHADLFASGPGRPPQGGHQPATPTA